MIDRSVCVPSPKASGISIPAPPQMMTARKILKLNPKDSFEANLLEKRMETINKTATSPKMGPAINAVGNKVRVSRRTSAKFIKGSKSKTCFVNQDAEMLAMIGISFKVIAEQAHAYDQTFIESPYLNN